MPPPRKNAVFRENGICSVWKTTPWLASQDGKLADVRTIRAASVSSQAPPEALARSSMNSASLYAPGISAEGSACIIRKLRECRVLPPRNSRGAASAMSTEAPAWRAAMAAHKAAKPPPMTRTSALSGSFAIHASDNSRMSPTPKRFEVLLSRPLFIKSRRRRRSPQCRRPSLPRENPRGARRR